jgi:hypothetical protein
VVQVNKQAVGLALTLALSSRGAILTAKRR